jgi:NitT/TauT family transport system substrate-binding protein
MIRTPWRLVVALVTLVFAFASHAQDKLTFSTDWLAQAEHGGFYQAVAEGIYKKHGLDVELKSGGP